MIMKRLALSAVALTILTALAGCATDSTKPDVVITPPPATETSATQSTAPSTSEAGFEVGKVLPDFSLPTVDGSTFTLSENLGKPVFINIFATWCPPCVGEMPEIEQLYTELGDSVNFLVIDVAEDEATVSKYITDNSYTLPFALSADGAPFGESFLIQFIPQTFVLKADGTISAYFDGARDYDSFKAAIEEAMAQ